MAAGGANAATYYVSPGGSDSAAGTSPGAAWGTFAHAMTVIQAGDTLLLEDGTYNQSLNITVSGTSSAYVTVKALNDGQAIVSTSYPASPLAIRHQSYIEVDGINFRNSGQYDSNVYCATDGLGYTDTDGLSIYYDDHIILRRDTSNGSSGCNSAVISLCADTNSLVEDCAASGQGRVVFDMLGSQNVTVRRSWLNWTGPDTGGGDVPSILQIYDSSNILFENNIGSNLTTTSTDVFSIFGHYGSVSGNKVIGNIIYVPNTTDIGGLRDDAVSGNTSTGEFFTNNVVIQADGYGGDEQGANYNDGTIFNNNTIVGLGSNTGMGILLRWDSSDISTMAVQNIYNNSFLNLSTGLYTSGSNPNYILAHDYNNFFNVSSILYGSHINPDNINTHETSYNPGYDISTYGLGAYLMVPSTLKGIGYGGADIGASILYEYVNGAPTSTPLWPWPMESRIVAEFGVSPTLAAEGGLWKTLNGVYPAGTSTLTSNSGTASTPVSGATSSPGTTSTSASGTTSSAQITAPQLLTPSQGQTVSTTVTLQWSPAKDPAPCTYTLYISQTQDFSGAAPIQVASAQNKMYAMGGGAAALLLFGLIIPGGIRPRRKLIMLLMAGVMAAGLLVSCGGGGSGSSQTSSSSPASSVSPSTSAVNYTVSGLSSNTTYYWKVVAQDNAGNTVQSQTGSFQTN